MRELMPHQAEGIAYLSRQLLGGQGGVLYLEQRLGKTLIIIRHMHALRAFFKTVLIVCPNSVKSTWAYELSEEGENNFIILDGTKKHKQKLLNDNNYKYVIVNYESVKLLELHLYNWGSVVLDESIYIANPKSERTKFFLRNFLHIKYKYILCGNPAPENIMQYFSQIQFVYSNFMGHINFWDWRLKNFNCIQYKYISKKGIKKDVYTYLRKNCFILTRAEANLGSKKLYQTLKIEITKEQKDSYNAMLKDFEADGVFTKYSPVKFLYLHKISGGVSLNMQDWHSKNKFLKIIELINEEFYNQQIIIWFKYIHEIEEMENILLSKPEIKFLKITGDTPSVGRNILRKAFLNKEYNVALMTIKSMRTGTDWSNADTAIYFSNEFSNDLRSQSEDRIIHPKIKVPKLIIDLATEGTLDYDVIDLLKSKKLNSEFFMSSLYEKILLRGAIT